MNRYVDDMVLELENNFIYDLQNMVVYGGSCYAASVKYFNQTALTVFVKQAIGEVEKELSLTLLEGASLVNGSLRNLLLMKATCFALEQFLYDIKIGAPKFVNLWIDFDKEETSERISDMLNDYKEAYSGAIFDFKKVINGDLRAITIPSCNEDEVLVIKIGSEDRPASEDDLRSVQLLLASSKNNPSLSIVTHHCFTFDVVKKKDLDNAIVTDQEGKS